MADRAEGSLRTEAWTTVAVAAALGCALACLAGGFALGIARPLPAGARALAPGALPAGLVALDPAAWVSLGILLLIATPLLRLVGMLATFRARRDRAALIATAAVLAIVIGSIALARLGVLPADAAEQARTAGDR